jgi:RimK family alpha-L-glutamate ligase
LKPLFGAQGRGISMIRSLADLPPPGEVADVYYLQRYVARPGPPYRDFRVFVCAGQVVAMMSRNSGDWITNVNRGGLPAVVERACENDLARLAIAASAAVGADFSGVDIIQSDDGGLLVLEINSMPAWTGLQSVAVVNVADAIADALMAFVTGGADAPVASLRSRRVEPASP